MSDVDQLIEEYVAIWNEPDTLTRRKMIRSRWVPEGTTCYRMLDSRGHDAIEDRIATAQQKWVRDAGYLFRSGHNAESHHDIVKFNWEMGPRHS